MISVLANDVTDETAGKIIGWAKVETPIEKAFHKILRISYSGQTDPPLSISVICKTPARGISGSSEAVAIVFQEYYHQRTPTQRPTHRLEQSFVEFNCCTRKVMGSNERTYVVQA